VAKQLDGTTCHLVWRYRHPPWPHCVRWGPSSPKGAQQPPIFDPCLLWANGLMDQDAAWYGGRPRRWPHCVRWGPSSPPPKGAKPLPNCRPICCGQMAGWIKMPLDMEDGLGPGDFVLDGDAAPPLQKGAEPLSPIFGQCPL